MKKNIFLPLLILAATSCKAQIARWVIHPECDSMYIDTDNKIVFGRNAESISFWDEVGKPLNTTRDQLFPFREGKAVALKPNIANVTGFYELDGTFTNVEPCDIACGHPFFADGFLLVKKNKRYQFVNAEGKAVGEKYTAAYPYSRGLAACYTFEDTAKLKDPLCFYITTGNEIVSFTLQGKAVARDDVDFVSSLSDEGVGIVVVKRKVYYYDAASATLSPMFAKEGDTEKKKQISIDGEMQECIAAIGDSLFTITTKTVKNANAEIVLDKLYKPLKIDFRENGSVASTRVFEKKKRQVPTFTTTLTKRERDGKWMVECKGKPVVDYLFNEVVPIKGNTAFVRLGDKWGMIDVEEGDSFRFKINNGEDVGFRHKNFKTKIRLDMPMYVPSKKTRFDTVESNEIHIDGTSIDERDTDNGNFVQYDCAIDIPPTLQDTMSCNVQVRYDGLLSPVIPVKFKVWHVKRFNVDILDDKLNVSGGECSFTINIDENKIVGEADYPFDVSINASDSVIAISEKLSETRYKITLQQLVNGPNEFSVNILENGCPPQNFPFEVEYTKPVPKTRRTKAVEEGIKIRRKLPRSSTTSKWNKESSTSSPTPIIPI